MKFKTGKDETRGVSVHTLYKRKHNLGFFNRAVFWFSVFAFALTMLWLIFTKQCGGNWQEQAGMTNHVYQCTTDIECYEECVQIGDGPDCHHIMGE